MPKQLDNCCRSDPSWSQRLLAVDSRVEFCPDWSHPRRKVGDGRTPRPRCGHREAAVLSRRDDSRSGQDYRPARERQDASCDRRYTVAASSACCRRGSVVEVSSNDAARPPAGRSVDCLPTADARVNEDQWKFAARRGPVDLTTDREMWGYVARQTRRPV